MYIRNYLVKIVSTKNNNKHYHEDENGYVFLPHNEKYSINLRNFANTRCEAEVYIDGTHMGTWVMRPKENLTLERGVSDDGYFTFYRAGSKKATKAGLNEVDKNLMGLVSVKFTPEKYTPPVTTVTTHGGIEWIPYVPPIDPWPTYPLDPWKPIPRPKLRKQHEFGASDPIIGSSGSPFRNLSKTADSEDQVDNFSVTCGANVGGFNSGSRGMSMNSISVGAPITAGGTGLSGNSDQQFITVPHLTLDTLKEVTINLRLVCSEQEEEIRPKKAFSSPIPPPIGTKYINPISIPKSDVRRKKRGY